jgi:hypothetical protein
MGARTFTSDDGRVRTDPYLAVDLRLEKTLWGDRIGLFVGVDNLLNNGGLFLTVRPRTFWLGLSARRAPDAGASD